MHYELYMDVRPEERKQLKRAVANAARRIHVSYRLAYQCACVKQADPALGARIFNGTIEATPAYRQVCARVRAGELTNTGLGTLTADQYTEREDAQRRAEIDRQEEASRVARAEALVARLEEHEAESCGMRYSVRARAGRGNASASADEVIGDVVSCRS